MCARITVRWALRIARAFAPFTHLMAGVNGGNERRGDDAPPAEEQETTALDEVTTDAGSNCNFPRLRRRRERSTSSINNASR